MNRPPEVAILVVSYNSAAELGDCLHSLQAHRPTGVTMRVVVADNASTDSSAQLVRERFPEVDLIVAETNRGFTGGNNRGWEHICRTYSTVDYLVLLNPDTVVTANWLDPLLACLEQHERTAAAQPMLRLPDDRHIDTAGNRSHYLGFGFTTGHGEADRGQYDEPRVIDFASGAAMMIRADVVKRHGLFDEAMFMYLEDAALGWHWRLMGYEVRMVPTSVVLHRHDPAATLQRHLEHLERNRWWLLLTCYKWRTIVLLLPPLIVAELGVVLLALRQGNVGSKWRAWRAFANPSLRRALWERRRIVQQSRTITDRQLTETFAARFDTSTLNRGMVRYIANPLLAAYWRVARWVLRW